MTDFIKTYSIDFDNLEVKDKYVDSDWDELICEHEGCFSSNDQYIMFNCNGIEVCVNFELCVSGYVSYDPGDYWTPPCSDTNITDVDVNIESILVDDYEVDFGKETLRFLESKIKEIIS